MLRDGFRLAHRLELRRPVLAIERAALDEHSLFDRVTCTRIAHRSSSM